MLPSPRVVIAVAVYFAVASGLAPRMGRSSPVRVTVNLGNNILSLASVPTLSDGIT